MKKYVIYLYIVVVAITLLMAAYIGIRQNNKVSESSYDRSFSMLMSGRLRMFLITELPILFMPFIRMLITILTENWWPHWKRMKIICGGIPLTPTGRPALFPRRIPGRRCIWKSSRCIPQAPINLSRFTSEIIL